MHPQRNALDSFEGVWEAEPDFRSEKFLGDLGHWRLPVSVRFGTNPVASCQLPVASWRGRLAVDAGFQKPCQAVEVAVEFDKANFGDQRFRVHQLLERYIVQIQLA